MRAGVVQIAPFLLCFLILPTVRWGHIITPAFSSSTWSAGSKGLTGITPEEKPTANEHALQRV